ncbi:MAG: c-type cytochrome [Rhodothermales bacterium]|nr:c-type cytochrome [Rhodothermales bacterium]
MRNRPHIPALTATLVLFLIVGCGGASDSEQATPDQAGDQSSLTADQIENGIGPAVEVNLGPIDEAMAAKGEAIFTSKCAACHKMDKRYVGPPLADVTKRRSARFIMNMMLNPDQMIREHPTGKEMFATYMTPMPSQNLTEEDARHLLEYLRTQVPVVE